MLMHCKSNAIHCKIHDICIAAMLLHCENNAIHYKNNAIHCKMNDICTAWMLSHCKNTAFQYKTTKSNIYVSRAPPAGSLISPSPEAPKTTRKGYRAAKTISHTYTYPHTWQFTWPPGGASGFGKISVAKLPLDDELLEAAPATNTSDPKICSNAACCALDNVVLDASCLAMQARSSTFCRIKYLNLAGYCLDANSL